MHLRIETLPEKKLVGKTLRMCLAKDQTHQLWSGFMPERNLIQNKVGTDFLSVQLYDPALSFNDFSPQTEFAKCAMVEVSEFKNIPRGMETLTLVGGLYAVFLHKDKAQDFPKTMEYILGQWLPNLDYEVDQRAHFEVLEAQYKPNSGDSEEEVFIPIRLCNNNSL
jgi:AraC family transcriptional regulator